MSRGRTRNSVPAAVAVLAALGLVACAAPSSDPREGGLVGGIAGLGSSGAYQERVRTREERLAALRATQESLEGERRALEASQREWEAQLAAERAQLEQLDAELAALSEQVDGLMTQRAASDTRLAALRERLGRLQAAQRTQQSALDALEGSGLGGSNEDLRRRQLVAQRDALREEFELLLQLSLELAR
jgi:chromosome segregation ATPase